MDKFEKKGLKYQKYSWKAGLCLEKKSIYKWKSCSESTLMGTFIPDFRVCLLQVLNPILHGLCEIRYYTAHRGGGDTLCPLWFQAFITWLTWHLDVKTWSQMKISIVSFP